MKKNYESPKSEIITFTRLSFLSISGEAGDKYAADRFESSFGNSF